MTFRGRNIFRLFVTILCITSVLPCGSPQTCSNSFYKHDTEKRCLKQTFAKSELYGKSETRLKSNGKIIEELSRKMKVMEERIVELEKRVERSKQGGEEVVSKLEQDIKDPKDITDVLPKKVETLINSVNRLDSTVSHLSGQMESFNNRVKSIDDWKTEIENLELPKVRQDAKEAPRGVKGWFEMVHTLMQDVGNISINVTSVNFTVSDLANNVTALVSRLADVDAWQKQTADKGDATRKVAEDAGKAAAENARNVQKLSLEVENTNTKLTSIDIKISAFYLAIHESTASLMSWRTEISEKELPVIKQNITNNRKLLQESSHNASLSSRLLQGHILWANDTYAEFKKYVNETHKREEKFKDVLDSMNVEVEKLKNISQVLSVDVANITQNVSNLQLSAKTVQTQVLSNVDKLETVTHVVGNITTNITAINKTAEHLSSLLNVTKEDVESLATWKTDLVHMELPTLKQEVKQVQQNTVMNKDLLEGHIVWANWTYEEFQNHRNATDKKVEEFTGKHDTTDRKLDGEELDGAMTKAELSQLKGKTTFHDIASLVTLLNTIVGVFVMMYLWQTLSSASSPAPAVAAARAVTSFRNDIQRGSRREEVYELSWTAPMENSLCVVTFHTETELKHADQTRSVFESAQQPCPTIHTRVIRCHADITQLPGSRVFLVFVDFNERNVILEDPSKGLGDLRVTTVRSLWAFGADVTVIYCGDRGSVNLGSGLFNPDLGSIHRQKELTQLKKSDRILSICSDFSNDQKEHCRNFINRVLKRKHTSSADDDFSNHQ